MKDQLKGVGLYNLKSRKKFLCTGDWHLTDKTPENRIDDYPEVQFKKIEWILDLAKEKKCNSILQPGDMFDSALSSYDLIRRYITLFKEKGVEILTVAGQHDQRYHTSDLNNTPIGVLNAAGVVKIIEEINWCSLTSGLAVAVYGAGWEAPIPKINNKEAFNILICHKMMIKDDKIWFGQTGHSMARSLLIKSGFDLIVSGDNHMGFKTSSKGGNKTLINCGSLMRSRIDQMDHIPKVYIVDVETNDIEEIKVPIKTNAGVFEVQVEEEKERNLDLESFIEQISVEEDIKGLKYKVNVSEFIKEKKIDKNIEDFIGKLFDKVT